LQSRQFRDQDSHILAEGLRKRKLGPESQPREKRAPRVRTLKSSIFALAALCALARLPARADEPANSLKSLGGELTRCMSAVRLAKGTDVTVQFTLNRRGALIGKPRITHAQWAGDAADRKASAASIAQGLDHCLPAAITDALGGAIAGHPLVYRFRGAHEDRT
jgi:hypothetical protein